MMTKKELIEALEGLSDDALIYLEFQTMDECFIGQLSHVDNKVTGDDVQNEITLCYLE